MLSDLIKEVLNKKDLSEETKVKAISSLLKINDNKKLAKECGYSSYSKNLFCAFIWTDTPDGLDFWSTISYSK